MHPRAMHPRARRVGGLVLLLSALLLVSATPGFARALDVEDVIRLHFAGVSEDVIISELIVTDSEFELTVDELVRLKNAGLSDRLLKFMIDTALPSEEEDALALAEQGDYLDEEGYLEDGYGQIWENVIIEEPVQTTQYFATLGWSYPTWYYDSYWYDYWYWDCGYAPYRSSWCVSFGAWYPGWYTYRSAWASACWGYRGYYPSHAYNQGWNDGYAWGYSDGWNDAGGGTWPQGLSDVKYKQAGSGSGKVLYTDAGLSMGHVRTLTKHTSLAKQKTRTKKILVADTRYDGRLDTAKWNGSRARPIRVSSAAAPKRHASNEGGVRSVTRTNSKSVTDRRQSRRPTRQVAAHERGVVTRRPSGTSRTKVDRTPVKVRQRSGATVTPRTPKRTTPQVKTAPQTNRKSTPKVKTAPQTKHRSTPQVRSAPARQRSSSGARSAPRSQPRSSPKSRGGR